LPAMPSEHGGEHAAGETAFSPAVSPQAVPADNTSFSADDENDAMSEEDMESEEGMESEEFCEGHTECTDEEVWELRCAASEGCGCTLTLRGMSVWLIAERSTTLYSSDIPTEFLREGDKLTIETCECNARHVLCNRCSGQVGYHVTKPCVSCEMAGHNGHYWLFHARSVRAEKRGFRWSELPYNGSPQRQASEDCQPSEAQCLICAASPMWRPMRVRGCGHVFCFGCISREVDARGKCPLDRLPITRDYLEPVVVVDPAASVDTSAVSSGEATSPAAARSAGE